MITIIDYGMGNLGSLKNMLKKIGFESLISDDPDKIAHASILILPGVGSFDQGIKNLTEKGIKIVLDEAVINKETPILGICLGMQLLTESSEEGKLPGLGWVSAATKRFSFKTTSKLKIPHMGWNTVSIDSDTTLFNDMPGKPRFYFVHSYHVVCNDSNNILTTTEHGYSFTSGIINKNITGVQFHPEKSHKFGMQFLTNYLKANVK